MEEELEFQTAPELGDLWEMCPPMLTLRGEWRVVIRCGPRGLRESAYGGTPEAALAEAAKYVSAVKNLLAGHTDQG